MKHYKERFLIILLENFSQNRDVFSRNVNLLGIK